MMGNESRGGGVTTGFWWRLPLLAVLLCAGAAAILAVGYGAIWAIAAGFNLVAGL